MIEQAEEVYSQVVYSVVHSIGRAAGANTPNDLLDYARKVFQFGIERHQDIVQSVRQINVISISRIRSSHFIYKLEFSAARGGATVGCRSGSSSQRQGR